jgi:hypothetical protein
MRSAYETTLCEHDVPRRLITTMAAGIAAGAASRTAAYPARRRAEAW